MSKIEKPKYKNGTTLWNVVWTGNDVIKTRIEITNRYISEIYGTTGYEYDVRVYTNDSRGVLNTRIPAEEIDHEIGFDDVQRAYWYFGDCAFTSERRADRFVARIKKEKGI